MSIYKFNKNTRHKITKGVGGKVLRTLEKIIAKSSKVPDTHFTLTTRWEIPNLRYHVEGGIGIFGSFASDTVQTFFKRQ